MADYTRQVKRLMSDGGCYFVRYGKGDHEVWRSPITNKTIIVDGSIKKRSSALKTLKKAGITEKV
jgi:hypothetical protein